MNKIFLIIIGIGFSMMSCKPAQVRNKEAVENFGYIENVKRTEAAIQEYASKWNVPKSELYIIDEEGYMDEIWSYNDKNRRLTHDLYQWHQLMVFDNKGSLISYQLNCDSRIKNNDWQWNELGTFDQFPPADNTIKKYQKELSLENIAPYFIHEIGKSFIELMDPTADISIIIYWTIYNGRQSKNLIQTILAYKAKFPDKKINIAFVNQPSPSEINELANN